MESGWTHPGQAVQMPNLLGRMVFQTYQMHGPIYHKDLGHRSTGQRNSPLNTGFQFFGSFCSLHKSLAT